MVFTNKDILRMRKEVRDITKQRKQSFDVRLFRGLQKPNTEFTLMTSRQEGGLIKQISRDKALSLKKEFGLKPMRQGGIDLGVRGLIPKKKVFLLKPKSFMKGGLL